MHQYLRRYFASRRAGRALSPVGDWTARLLADPEMLQMGHCQRHEDLNLGMGWLYYGLARLIRPHAAVVIGSWRGFVPLIIAKALADNVEGGRVAFIDPSIVDDFWRDPGAVRAHFAGVGVTNIDHFLLTTQQFVETPQYHEITEIGLVMIDGYHTAHQAQFDFEAFIGKVSAGGVVLLHDSLDTSVVKLYGPERAYRRSVSDFVAVLRRDTRYQVFDLPYAKGLSLVRKVGETVKR